MKNSNEDYVKELINDGSIPQDPGLERYRAYMGNQEKLSPTDAWTLTQVWISDQMDAQSAATRDSSPGMKEWDAIVESGSGDPEK